MSCDASIKQKIYSATTTDAAITFPQREFRHLSEVKLTMLECEEQLRKRDDENLCSIFSVLGDIIAAGGYDCYIWWSTFSGVFLSKSEVQLSVIRAVGPWVENHYLEGTWPR